MMQAAAGSRAMPPADLFNTAAGTPQEGKTDANKLSDRQTHRMPRGHLTNLVVVVMLLLLYAPCRLAVKSPDIYFAPTSPLSYPIDPAPLDGLSSAENTALADLYAALIKGSTAEAVHHANWAATLSSSTTTNMCALDGTYTYTNHPLAVNMIPCTFKTYTLLQPCTRTDALTSWCDVDAAAQTKYLRAIDLDLVPTVYDDGARDLVKDPGQIKYISDAAYCHPKNWYAMIATQRAKSQFRYSTYWGPAAVESFGGCVGPFPQTACPVAYSAAGTLPSSLGSLTALTSLRLRLLGIAAQPIPAWIGGMMALTCLDLSFNSFSRTLPSSLFLLTNLVRLHLNDNQLSGSIPTQIGLLTALQILEIGYHSYDANAYEDYGAIPQFGSNSLSGTIPTEICSLKNLRQLQINSNGLSGTLPACMSAMTALRLVDVRFNSLTGALPHFYPPPVSDPWAYIAGSGIECDSKMAYTAFTAYTAWTSLHGLGKIGMLSPGQRESDILATYFPALNPYWCPWYFFYVLANNNNFSGPLPAYLAPSLGFAGLPDMYGSLRGGTQYTASGTNIDLSAIRVPDWISIRGNAFTGPIPQFLSGGSLLGTAGAGKIDLSANRLTGPVPLWIGTAWSYHVNLAFNSISGTIPDCFTNTLFVDLSSNLLTGTIPASFIANVGFQSLSLANNRIKQDIREIITLMINNGGNSFQLAQAFSEFTTFDLTGNAIFGMLPGDMFVPQWPAQASSQFMGQGRPGSYSWNYAPIKNLLLNSNKISGTIPLEIAYLTNLVVLDLGNNLITGTLPSSLSAMTRIETLIVRGNKLNTFQTHPTAAPTPSPIIVSGNSPPPPPPLPGIGLVARGSSTLLRVAGPATQLDFLPNMTALVTADFSDSGIQGGLPGATPPNLKSITLSSDCNAVFIPASLCVDSPGLQTIAMDGLQTDNLRSARCEQSYWSDTTTGIGFTGKHPVLANAAASGQPTIPSCIFQMTALRSLHLSGNGFHGSLPEAITPSLTDLVLSHNLLSGTIPDSIRHRAWAHLDLSYNQLSGDLTGFQAPTGPLSLSVNALSGEIPLSLSASANINVLEGNSFSCGSGRQSLPQNDPYIAQFHCGSDTYNSALYACLAAALALLLLVVLSGWRRGRSPVSALAEMARLLVLGFGASSPEGKGAGHEGVEGRDEEKENKGDAEAPHTTRDDNASPVANTIADDALPFPEPTAPEAASQHRLLQAYHVLLAVFDVASVLVVNIGFVLLNANQTNETQTALKTALAIFKIGFNGSLLPALDAMLLPGYTRHSLIAAKTQLYGSSSTFLALLLIFNSVFAPLFSSAVADVTCFKNVFFAADPVSVSYSYNTCEAYYGSYWWQACLRDKAVVTQFSYTPAFSYTYKCSSTILTLYTPVFIQQFLISTFTGPLLDVLKWILFARLSDPSGAEGAEGHWLATTLRAALLGLVSPFLLPRAAREERCLKARKDKAAQAERAARDRQDHKVTIFARLPVLGALRMPVFWKSQAAETVETEEQRVGRLQDEADNRPPAFFSGDALLNSVVNQVIVMLTFGLVAPLLALVITFLLVFQLMLLEGTIAAFWQRECESAACTDHSFNTDVDATVKGCLRSLTHIRRFVMLLGAAVVLGGLPIVTGLSARYSTLSYPEGWVTTVAYVGGVTPAGVLLGAWMAVLGLFRFLLAWNGRTGHSIGVPHEAVVVGGKALPLEASAASGNTCETAATADDGHVPSRAAFDFDFDAADDFLGPASLMRDAQSVSDDALHSIAPIVLLLAGIFICVFLWDIMGAAVGWRSALPVALLAALLPLALGVLEAVYGAASRGHMEKRTASPQESYRVHVKPEPKTLRGGASTLATVCASSSDTLPSQTTALLHSPPPSSALPSRPSIQQHSALGAEEAAAAEKISAPSKPGDIETGALGRRAESGEREADSTEALRARAKPITVSSSCSSSSAVKSQTPCLSPRVVPVDYEEARQEASDTRVVLAPCDLPPCDLPQQRTKPVAAATTGDLAQSSSVAPLSHMDAAGNRRSDDAAAITTASTSAPSVLESSLSSSLSPRSELEHSGTVRRLEEHLASLHAVLSRRVDEDMQASSAAAASFARQLEELRRGAAGAAQSLENQLAAERAERAALADRLRQTDAELKELRMGLVAATAAAAAPQDPSPTTDPTPSAAPPGQAAVTKAELQALSSRLEAAKSDIFALSSGLDETNASLEAVRERAAAAAATAAAAAAAAASAASTSQPEHGSGPGLDDRLKILGDGIEQTNAELAALRRDIAGPFYDADGEGW